ncbi:MULTISPECIES: ROK family transcriptional regulator [unclassified Mesorhizobium]|uniref:ROK family transcriptional regulator n=1 Tax=unclassified Mesorhizobium TaxID=325217 RepID=UPI000FDB6BBC|nr:MULTISPECIES: ROK family transcriptional regulator [unclassified Mesorhizobium]RWL44451.1 MAG: ROK family transcriptional regulator [Mesorhizobium sp.]TGQ11828.1 ROK family transcriptional regulator [Mesorhizobium sp. M2E.F.Ca.ET.219.01.1.1]TGS18160.1 ROK family transcriptional regulator [Mesorhizobium sp. M2E.F.Ca.ET.209.01.1.1]TGT70465.1 ROK family transcriptional regulator [Mesorhizobium sp. M2E.F.Ca.ET.166.01.1.1]TGV98700.1 ROK family transcriptional regulator [Mesorhizobium sp. M2E.F.C
METGIARHGSPEALERRLHRGTNQSGMRDHNERLVLSLVRQHGSLAKSDIARMTGLSAQTVSVIMRELEEDKLLVRQAPLRGKIGQPSIPMALNPEGAFFIGLKIGRRSAELVLIDFLGNVRAMLQHSYRYPAPRETVEFVTAGIRTMRGELTPAQDKRIAGLGVAMPFELWNWADTAGAPRDVMEEWRHRDIRADIQAQCEFPVYLQNDATSACGAELVFGQAGAARDFVYFYIGAFAGGGIVLNGRLYSGPKGNAGALGSMPVPGPDGKPTQLIDVASIAMLEKALSAKGIDGSYLWTSPQEWGDIGAELDEWIVSASRALAYAIVAASSVIDFEAAVIDGWMPLDVRRRLVEAIRQAISGIDAEGLKLPFVREGTVGIHARALGGASLPLSERFLIGPNTSGGA